MERRKAVTAAAATSLTLLVGAAGLTANAAILGRHEAGGIGQLQPVAADRAEYTATTTVEDDRQESAPTAGTSTTTAPATTPVPGLAVPAGDEGAEPIGAEAANAAPAPAAAAAAAAAPTAAPVVAPAPASAPTTAAPVTTTGGSAVGGYDDDDDHEPPEHEIQDTEHIGAEDDD